MPNLVGIWSDVKPTQIFSHSALLMWMGYQKMKHIMFNRTVQFVDGWWWRMDWLIDYEKEKVEESLKFKFTDSYFQLLPISKRACLQTGCQQQSKHKTPSNFSGDKRSATMKAFLSLQDQLSAHRYVSVLGQGASTTMHG